MTNKQAEIANEVYRNQVAYVGGVPYTVCSLDEAGAVLIDQESDEEIFADWTEIKAKP